MSWLISLMLAGVVFTSDSNIPVQKDVNYTNSETTKVVLLDETERFEQTYPLSATGRVSVSNVNGSITIETWDRNEVKLEVVKTAGNKDRLTEVEIKIDAQKDFLTIETDYGSWRRSGKGWDGKVEVQYHLIVPRNAVLDEIETVNGSVNITNSNNLTKASAVNGQVTATNLRGTANLSTVNGTVEASFDQLQSSGKITLDTVNGSINNDFGLPVRKGQYVGRDLYGKIGSGEVQIRLNSVNGGLNIKRKNDGKNVNPAVNLLPQKTKDGDEEDWDDDTDSESLINTAKMNKEISKSVKTSQKDAAVQMKNAQKDVEKARKEIEKIRPELAKINTAEMQVKIDEAMKLQKEAMKARLAEANFFNGAPVIEKKSETFPVKGTPKVSVDAKNCAVSVRGWDKQEVEYSITRISKRRNQKPLEFTVNHSDSEVKIIVSGGENSEDRGFFGDPERVRVEVFVPKKSNLRIHTDREIRLENVSGDIDLKGADESINVRDVDGKLKVASTDGRIRVIGFTGEIESETADGEQSLEGSFQKITATTGDGNIILTLPDDASAIIRANTDSVCLNAIAPSRIKTVDVSEGSSVWRIGNGSADYSFNLGDGQVLIRNISDLKAGL